MLDYDTLIQYTLLEAAKSLLDGLLLFFHAVVQHPIIMIFLIFLIVRGCVKPKRRRYR